MMFLRNVFICLPHLCVVYISSSFFLHVTLNVYIHIYACVYICIKLSYTFIFMYFSKLILELVKSIVW